MCSSQDFLSADPDIRKLLTERLHKLAKDHDHAKRMIERWLDTQTVAPKVADLVGLANTVRPSSSQGGLPAPCGICGPMGGYWVIRDFGQNTRADRCDCARGQALSAMDREREGLAIAA
jgi:hypothetical protein